MEQLKICTRCKVPKELNLFPGQKDKSDGKRCWCKLCLHDWYVASKERLRIKFIKRVYGLKENEYIALQKRQENKCAICGREEPLVIDHIHDTYKVRGLLCFHCNSGLGLFKDDINNLKQAVKYLEDNC